MDYGIDAMQITATTALFYTHTEDAGIVLPFTIYASDGATVIRQIRADAPGWNGSQITVAGFTPETTYIAKLNDYPTQTATFTTLPDEPRTATESQWQDLAARVKAKADASSIPTVNNSTITVTNNGLDKGTFTTNQATAGTVALDYPTITMTTTDPGEGAAISANNYVAVYGGDPIILDYSTIEINTGAKWIDGSAIYKKTVSTGTLPDTNATWTQHGISNMSKVIKVEGYATDGTTFHPLPYANTASNGSVAVQVSNTLITLSTTSDQSAYTESYITLYYTKSSS